MAANRTVDTESDIRAELQALKDDLLTVKEDVGKVTATAVKQGRAAADAFKGQATEGMNQGLDSARQCVQERPLTSAAVALGVGVGLGLLLTRR